MNEELLKEVLIVEPENRIKKALQNHFEGRDLCFDYTDTLEKAVNIFQRKVYEIVFVSLPDARHKNRNLINWFRRVSSQTRVYVIIETGTVTNDDAKWFGKNGASGIFRHPINIQKIITAISNAGSNSGFTGTVAKVDLSDYIQMLCMNGETRCISVVSPKGKGQIFIENEQVVHVSLVTKNAREIAGETAFKIILSWQNGIFRDSMKKTDKRTIDIDYTALVLEAARFRDEISSDVPDITDEIAGEHERETYSDDLADTVEIDAELSREPEIVPEHAASTTEKEPIQRVESVGKNKWKHYAIAASVFLAMILPALFLMPGSPLSTVGFPKLFSNSASAKSEAESPSLKTVLSKPSEVVLRIHGSNTVGAKLGPMFAESYLKDKLKAEEIVVKKITGEEKQIITGIFPDRTKIIEIEAYGSSTGFKSLDSGLCDIAMASRSIKEKEVLKLKRLGNMTDVTNEHIIALDGIAVIVHPANPMTTIDIETLSGLFSGKIRNWSQVGGKNGPVVIYARDKNSGTFDTFKSLVLKKKVPLSETAKRFDSNAGLSDAVSRDINGIGFTGLPYVKNNKALGIADRGADVVYPTFFTVATEDYSLSRRLYMYTSATPANPYVRDFIEFCHSGQGQKLAENAGFVNMNIRNFTCKPEILKKPQSLKVCQEYQDFVKDHRRLSLNFRFGRSDSTLDNRAHRDLSRVVDYLHNNLDREIRLVGFADSVGDYSFNRSLAMKRAGIVQKALKVRGIEVADIFSAGEEFSVASNMTKKGRQKNRRVEVWVR